jgi:hypothetical protein
VGIIIYADEFPYYQQSHDAKPKPKREQHCSAPVEVLCPRRLDGILDHAKPPSKIKAISIGLKVNTQLVAIDNGLQNTTIPSHLGHRIFPRSLPIASHEKINQKSNSTTNNKTTKQQLHFLSRTLQQQKPMHAILSQLNESAAGQADGGKNPSSSTTSNDVVTENESAANLEADGPQTNTRMLA